MLLLWLEEVSWILEHKNQMGVDLLPLLIFLKPPTTFRVLSLQELYLRCSSNTGWQRSRCPCRVVGKQVVPMQQPVQITSSSRTQSARMGRPTVPVRHPWKRLLQSTAISTNLAIACMSDMSLQQDNDPGTSGSL